MPRAGITLAPDEIVAFCKGRIADYKRPKRERSSATRCRWTAGGKVKKAELRAAYGGER